MKTKYERMSKEEKKKLVLEYKKTPFGITMFKRLIRINVIGIILIIYAIYEFLSNLSNLKWTNYFVSIPLFGIGLFFIVMAFRVRKKALNNFAIQKK